MLFTKKEVPENVPEDIKEQERREMKKNYLITIARAEGLIAEDPVCYDYDNKDDMFIDESGKVKILATFRRIIAKDLSASVMAQYLYDCKPGYVPDFPYKYVDRDKNEQTIGYGTVEVMNVSDAIPIVCPDIQKRLAGHILRKSPLDPEKMRRSDLPEYHLGTELLYPGGNRHKLVDAVANGRGGEIAVRVIDDGPLFDNLYTDGAYWYSKWTGEKLAEVSDWRIAVIFFLAQREREMEKKA